MKITNRGIHITEIGTEGVTSITFTDEQGVTVSFGWSTEGFTWSKDQARNLALALLAAIGEAAPKAEAGMLIDNDGDKWIRQASGQYQLENDSTILSREDVERHYGIRSEGIDVTQGREVDR